MEVGPRAGAEGTHFTMEDRLLVGAAQSIDLFCMFEETSLHSSMGRMLALVHMSCDVFLTIGEVRGSVRGWGGWTGVC